MPGIWSSQGPVKARPNFIGDERNLICIHPTEIQINEPIPFVHGVQLLLVCLLSYFILSTSSGIALMSCDWLTVILPRSVGDLPYEKWIGECCIHFKVSSENDVLLQDKLQGHLVSLTDSMDVPSYSRGYHVNPRTIWMQVSDILGMYLSCPSKLLYILRWLYRAIHTETWRLRLNSYLVARLQNTSSQEVPPNEHIWPASEFNHNDDRRTKRLNYMGSLHH